MNIKFNANQTPINNSWKNNALRNQQSLVSKLMGTKTTKGSSVVLDLSDDGLAKSKNMNVGSNARMHQGNVYKKSSVEDVMKYLENTDDAIVYDISDGVLYLDKVNMSCNIKDLKNAMNHNSPKTVDIKDNSISFDDKSYYRFEDGSGKEHKVLSFGGRLTDLFSDGYDQDEDDYMNFWNCMARKDPTFVPSEYSNGEVRKRLADAGIKTGFFDISIGKNKTTQFLSQGKNSSAVYSKEQYDEYYHNHIQSGNLTRKYEPGTVIKIAGEDYTIDDKGKIDVPYGVDIWDIEYPDKSNIKK